MAKEGDLPKSVVVVLVVLTIVITLLGTWSVMQEVRRIKEVPPGQNPVQTGRISISVRNPQTTQVTGKISVQVKRR
ncbi:hypothetical protein JW930_07355 [Candidatus Woesearchaeota archaeon]|nr:hypothetical protein [Candidatus Woesearchaeota archaeon]